MPPTRTFWPTLADYKDAAFNPENSFADEELRRAEALTDATGYPVAWTGSAAVVFQMKSGDKRWAVKCLTRQAETLAHRYKSLATHLQRNPLPFVVKVDPYQEEGVLIRGEWFPVIKMEWIEGRTLRAIVGDNLAKPATLKQMCQIWARMAKRQDEAAFTHCDLHHGNVLWVPGRKENSLAVKLIDLDGSWIPDLEGQPIGEAGLPHYQHPERGEQGIYSREVDRFSHLAVYCALRSLVEAGEPLWRRYDRDENLLFTKEDYLACREDGVKRKPSALLQELWSQRNEEVKSLAGWVTLAANGRLRDVPELWHVVSDTEVKPLEPRQIEQVERILQIPRRPPPPPREFVNSIGMKFVLVEPWTFRMGSPTNEADRYANEKQHEVTLTKAFYMAIHPVTQGQWVKVMGNNPSYFSRTGGGKDKVRAISDADLALFPVETVSWEDTQTFLNELAALNEEAKFGRKYRLPTEAEWEYACRGGGLGVARANSQLPFHFAQPTSSLSVTQANFDGNHRYGGAAKGPHLQRTSKVGSYEANAQGIFDMHGNVWEWCADWYGEYPTTHWYGEYATAPCTDPSGPSEGSFRVFRGGSWNDYGQFCRAAYRANRAPSYRYLDVGFRVVQVPVQ